MNFWAQNYLIIQTHKLVKNMMIMTLENIKNSAFLVKKTTGYGLDGPESNPGGGEIFHTCPDQPWGLLYNEYRVFPGGKAAGAWR
jgi:hypothetical protein